MILRTLAPLIAIAVALSACSAGGSTAASSPAILPGSAPQIATGTLAIGRTSAGAALTTRKPAYVSSATSFATLWIDANAGNRVACSPGAAGTCSINWTSTSGAHTFVAEVDDSATFSGPGTVLAQFSASENLTAGSNELPNITLDGVAGWILLLSEQLFAPGSPTCLAQIAPAFGGNCFFGTFAVVDDSGNVITPPGNFANGGACFAADPSLAEITSQCTLPISSSISFAQACVPGANGTFNLAASAANPSASLLSTAQLAAYALSYPNQSVLTVRWPAYSCTNGVIAAVGPANGSVTVQSAGPR
jgi:hypothetical protein